MKKIINLSTFGFVFIYVAVTIMLIYQYNEDFTQSESRMFYVLLFSYLWTGGLIVIAKLFFNLYFFEPILFISVLYELIFIIKPIVDLRNSAMYEHGINVFPGGVRATVFFTIGYTVMYFAYYSRAGLFSARLPVKNTEPSSVLSGTCTEENYEINPVILYVVWFILFALCVISMVSQGLSLRYIFSLGSNGDRSLETDNTALFFLANFGATLVTVWMMILIKTKGAAMKVFISALSVVYVLMRNARWLALIFISAPFIYYYTKRKKSPNWILILLISVVGIIVFAWMQFNRHSLTTGGGIEGWGEGGLSLSVLLAPFESDLNTYRTFYSMVTRFPSVHSYMYGRTFMYFFVLFVPRVLWPGKPDNPIRELIENSLNSQARISGTAVANIGELYANFGIIGIIAGMYIVGFVARLLRQHFIEKENVTEDDCIIYSIVFPLLFQWIARGNFSGNLYLTAFAVLPYIVLYFVKRFVGKKV